MRIGKSLSSCVQGSLPKAGGSVLSLPGGSCFEALAFRLFGRPVGRHRNRIRVGHGRHRARDPRQPEWRGDFDLEHSHHSQLIAEVKLLQSLGGAAAPDSVGASVFWRRFRKSGHESCNRTVRKAQRSDLPLSVQEFSSCPNVKMLPAEASSEARGTGGLPPIGKTPDKLRSSLGLAEARALPLPPEASK